MDTERIIGQLEAFQKWAENEFEDIKKEIHSLNRFRWIVYGGSAVVSSMMVMILELVFNFPGAH